MTKTIGFRVTESESEIFSQKAKEFGYASVGAFLKDAGYKFLEMKNKEKQMEEVKEGNDVEKQKPENQAVQPDSFQSSMNNFSQKEIESIIQNFTLHIHELLKSSVLTFKEKQEELEDQLNSQAKILSKLNLEKYDLTKLALLDRIAIDTRTTRNRQVRLMGIMEMFFKRVFRHCRGILEILSPTAVSFGDKEVQKCTAKSEFDVKQCFEELFTRSHNHPKFDLWRDNTNDDLCSELDGGYDVREERKKAIENHPQWQGKIPEELRYMYFNNDSGNEDYADTTEDN